MLYQLDLGIFLCMVQNLLTSGPRPSFLAVKSSAQKYNRLGGILPILVSYTFYRQTIKYKPSCRHKKKKNYPQYSVKSISSRTQFETTRAIIKILLQLYLQSNNLSDIDSRLLSRWDLLEKIDVSDNPYLCDCSTQWIVDVLVPLIEEKKTNSSLMV